MRLNLWCFLFVVLLASGSAQSIAAIRSEAMQNDLEHINSWNEFADAVYKLHQAQIKNKPYRTTSTRGGYPDNPDFYIETRYFDSKSGRLLSRVQRESRNPERVHVVEVFIHNQQGKVVRDYLAAYLPQFRNAPIQTLINFHSYKSGLHAFRQFDASGARIYEQCRGRLDDEDVFLSLEEHEFDQGEPVLSTREYQRCFDTIPKVAGRYLKPLNEFRTTSVAIEDSPLATQEERDLFVDIYSDMLENDPTNTEVLMKRARLYFEQHDFDLSVSDYTDVIRLDDRINEAWFGRGMAHGRNGNVREGIADLSEYIRRVPDSSLAYTKRGVRYLWIGDEKHARQDLIKAIELNPKNAEAHDDLGVIYARQGQHARALEHFQTTVSLDPSYMKGHHNMAMVLFITGKSSPALTAVDRALALSPKAKGTLLLKAEILKSLGRHQQARQIEEEAEFLPEGNWSEQLSIQ